jgi:hypothetical protein
VAGSEAAHSAMVVAVASGEDAVLAYLEFPVVVSPLAIL